jgi:hypothetical protein
MTKQVIRVPTVLNDGAHRPVQEAVRRVNANFTELYDRAVSPADFGTLGIGNDTSILQGFFDYISTNNVGTATCSGNFSISAGLTIGPASGEMATLHIVGRAVFTASTAIDTMLYFRNCPHLVWNGMVKCDGTGSTSYASRTCRIGIKIGDDSLQPPLGKLKFDRIGLRRFNQVGLAVYSESTFSDYGQVNASDCGSGHSFSGGSLTANWSNRVDNGTSGSVSQTTVIDVDVLPPTTRETPLLVVINSQPYYVSSVDTGTSKLTVYPWIDNTLTSGALNYMFGGGVYVFGGDAGVVRFTLLDFIRTSVGLWQAALYGPVVDRLSAQSGGIGLMFGASPSASCVTTQINGFYTEANDIDIVRLTRGPLGANIVSTYEIDFTKIKYACNPRQTDNSILHTVSEDGQSLRTVKLYDRWGTTHEWQKAPLNQQDAKSALGDSLGDIFKEPKYQKTFMRDSWTINLKEPGGGGSEVGYKNGAWGYDSGRLIIISPTNTNGAPAGTITFDPIGSSTANGGATASFAGFTGPAVFDIYYKFSTTDFIVRCHTHAPTGSATFNPKNLVDGDGETTTVTVTGAVLGDFAEASFSIDLQGVELHPWVSATDTVSVRFQNETGGVVDLASGTLYARVKKRV